MAALIQEFGGSIIPVDSEHSALFQAMQGNRRQDIERLILTASGGPFLHTAREDFVNITPDQALRHPRWEMGKKITIDSATLMNKALEFIEAFWLFEIDSDKIEVVVHPQSIVHSVVAYVDGSQLAQLSSPDMRGPIAYAMKFPHGRSARVVPPLSLIDTERLDFLALDEDKFESIQLARECLAAGGISTIVLNIANEIAVESFLAGSIAFSDIFSLLRRAIDRYDGRLPDSVDSVIDLVDSLQSELRSECSTR
jgi:1-deoxy-D-xylulose-5-phosphate reductoisomerase